MLDQHTINLLERLVIAKEAEVAELREINKKLDVINIRCVGGEIAAYRG